MIIDILKNQFSEVIKLFFLINLVWLNHLQLLILHMILWWNYINNQNFV